MRPFARSVAFGTAFMLSSAALTVAGGPGFLALPTAEAASTFTTTTTADTYTRYDAPTANFGTSYRWAVDGRAAVARRAYLKFALPAVPDGGSITQATLSAYVDANGGSAGPGPAIYRTDNSWTETGVTWAKQPALGTRVAVTSAPYAAGTWVTWDVTAGLSATEKSAGGTVSFALTTAEKKWLGFRSRESGLGPKLTIATSSLTAPAPSAAQNFGWGTRVSGDEFNTTGAPDDTKWSIYNGPGHDGKGLRRPSAWSLDGTTATVSGDAAGTTGGMSAKFDRREYGRWEVRMRTSVRDSEYHPLALLWPDVSTSTCPEIDFAEGTKDVTRMNFFNHYGCGGVQSYAIQSIDTTQWHNYAVEWTPTAIVGYVDGQEWFRDTDPTHQPTVTMHLALQLDWFPDGTATTPSWAQFDWVRIYNVG